jgi:1,2-diacylglycerol 3-alpha-glucosyltransferase
MHIFFVTNNYRPYCGGVVSSIDSFTSQLRAMGQRVTIVTLDFSADYVDSDREVIRLHCPIRFRYKKNYMAIPWRVRKQLDSMISTHRPDIIHVHHPFLLGPIAVTLAKMYEIPAVYTYHTMYDRYTHYIPLIPQAVTRFLVRWMVDSFLKQVDAIIAPSSYVRVSIDSEKIKAQLFQIASPIDDIFLKNRSVEKNIDPTKIHLISVSRFAKEKNIRALLDLMTLLDERFFLTLVGYGWEYEELQEYAFTKLGLSSLRVLFRYKPTKEDLVICYTSAHLFVYASQTDTQAIVLAEAMASGLPVISLPGPGQADSVINGYNGYIVQSIEDMKKKIMMICSNMQLYHHLSRQAHKTAQGYTKGHLTGLLWFCYQQICKDFRSQQRG